jgi:SHS2 domain-containing protein
MGMHNGAARDGETVVGETVVGATGPGVEPSGHSSRPLEARVLVEAWGRNREECLIEALYGLVDSCADVTGVRPRAAEYVRLPDGADQDLLVGLMSEVVVRLEVDRTIPVDAEAEVLDGGVGVRLELADLDDVELVAPLPTSVSTHGLRCAPDRGGWSCSVTICR